MRIAFYAPLKSPAHPVPSGDRMMARLLMRALERAGHHVGLASEVRAYALEESVAAQVAIRDTAHAEADRLIAGWRTGAGRPDLWFTYHLYYRAPDWIGPAVAEALSIPYVVAEASFAMKRAKGVWAIGHDATARALAAARLVFCLAMRDRAALAKAPGFAARLVDLPPFVDVSARPRPGVPARANAQPTLLAVAMMRARAKVESYNILARSLAEIADLDWRLLVAGDGPARPAVAAALARFAGRVTFLGALEPDALDAAYRQADLLIWPGFDEAYGMVYLEAQAAGLPVIAMDYGGVGGVVRDGVSGRLVPAGDVDAFGGAIRSLIGNPGARRMLSASATTFVARERSVDRASQILGAALHPLAVAA